MNLSIQTIKSGTDNLGSFSENVSPKFALLGSANRSMSSQIVSFGASVTVLPVLALMIYRKFETTHGSQNRTSALSSHTRYETVSFKASKNSSCPWGMYMTESPSCGT